MENVIHSAPRNEKLSARSLEHHFYNANQINSYIIQQFERIPIPKKSNPPEYALYRFSESSSTETVNQRNRKTLKLETYYSPCFATFFLFPSSILRFPLHPAELQRYLQSVVAETTVWMELATIDILVTS